jgi:hypothetical protein
VASTGARATVGPMDRRAATAAIVAGLAVVGACREATVRIHPDPQVGDRARYRYEIEATITRALEGDEPVTSEISSELVADQEVRAITDAGIEAEVTLRRDGAPAQTATVVLDPTGAIRSIQLVEGLQAEGLGLTELASLLPPATQPPTGSLAPGARWSIAEGALEGRGRLMRLGIVDDADVAVVETTLRDAIDEAVAAGASAATLHGDLRAETTASYRIDDGTVWRSSARSHGEVQATIEPPAGVDAAPALGTISYDIRVRVTRLR